MLEDFKIFQRFENTFNESVEILDYCKGLAYAYTANVTCISLESEKRLLAYEKYVFSN